MKEVRHEDHTLYNFIYRKCPGKAHRQRKKQISGRLAGCVGSGEMQSDSLMGMELLSGVMKISKIDCGEGRITLNILKTIELYF